MGDDRTSIDWDDARASNRENWEDRVPLHEKAYGISAFDAPDHLSSVVRTDLAALAPFLPDGTVTGLDVCHLQCHIGTDTLSLARAGARVTGVDFSRGALASAAGLAQRLGLDATWVETDVLDARAAVPGDFDLVYTSIGTITWLADLDRWAAQVAGLLRAGGTFYIRDGHPFLEALDETADGLHLRYPYFSTGRAQVWDEDSTYAGEGTVAHTRTYQWPHPLSEILNSLIGAGLQILRVDEGTTLPWKFSPRMVEVPDGFAWPESERDLVPCTYTIIARKPHDAPATSAGANTGP
jgi:SAM-dependent methyltransferase